MLNRNLSLCAAVYFVLFVSIAHAQLPQISSGLNYLSSSQNTEGAWSTDSSVVDTTAATVSALESMKLLNQTTGTPYTAGISWLQGLSPQSIGYIAERVRALSLGDGSANELIAALDPITGAWGGGEGYEIDVLDTSIVLGALKSVNYADITRIFKTIEYLTTQQNIDGGWGFTQGDDSNVFVTAHVLSTLSQFKSLYIMDQQLTNAAAFLLSKQNLDGGFGSSPSTVYETALALIALIESGQGTAVP